VTSIHPECEYKMAVVSLVWYT